MIMTGVKKKSLPKSLRLDFKQGRIDLSHGGGGRAMAQLIEQLFITEFNNEWLAQRNDQACFDVTAGRMVMTTDAHVISPLFFPGGDIGCLAVHGTVNDIAMSGARPLYLSASFIIEEGFPLAKLQTIVQSMALAAKETGVAIICGDTKVVERGKGDGVFITTTGVGVVPKNIYISGDLARPGDRVIINGSIGDHGVAVMSQRNNLQFYSNLKSDTASLHDLVAMMIEIVPTIHCLRDPTRGGLGTTLNEFAHQSQVGFIIDENKIPIDDAVAGACELLGLDPLYVANEGKLVAICPEEECQKLLEAMRSHPRGKKSAIIGEVIEDPRCFVQLKTQMGGMRIVDWLSGEQLPRIC